MTTIKDLCWQAREQKRMTAQAIADESGVSFSTINNFFASASKNPSVYTVGPICAVLDVSLDRYFGIVAGEDLSGRDQALLSQQVTHKDEMIRLLRASVRNRDRIISVLLLALILALLYAITMDVLNPDMGLARY